MAMASSIGARASQGSILHLLRQREMERNDCKIERLGGRITRSVIIQSSMEFCPVWSKSSKKSVCIGLDRRIYFDKYQTCYFVEGCAGKPKEMYRLPVGRFKIDINSMILYNCHLRKRPTTVEEQRPCLLVQTTDGWLKVLDACSGECLRAIFVSSIIKFSSLDWADYYHTVQLTSTVNQNRHRSGPHPPPLSDRLMVIYIFKIHPLQLVGSFSINRSVFGARIRDAELSEDVLVISLSNNTFNFYSFHWILSHCTVLKATLGEWVEMDGGRRSGIVGEPGFGVPLTMNITECPPLLFTAQSSLSYGVQFGGSPAVFCHNALPKLPDVFHIRALSGKHLVAELKSECPTMNSDVANFHFDNYQRFIHIHGCTYSSYRICHRDGQPHGLEKQYSVDFKQQSPLGQEQPETPVVTLSGRVVKRRSTDGGFNDLSSSLHKVELEDEVDLVYAVVTLPAGYDDVSANLFFLDDKTGTILKRVEIPTWKQGLSNLIDYELDCILHVVQDGSTSTCHYYRLKRTKR